MIHSARGVLLPWQLPIESLAHGDIVALQAFAEGRADELQQRQAWKFIREGLCRCEEMSFWSGGEDGRRATDFAEGKRWVGLQMRRIARMRPTGNDTTGELPALPQQEVDDGAA